MRLRSSSVFLTLMAVLTLSVVQAASASAEACHKKAGSKKWSLCVEGTKTANAKFTLTLKTGTKANFGPRPGDAEAVTCTQGGGTGAFAKNAEIAYVSTFEIAFKGCEITGKDAEQGCRLSRSEIPWGSSSVESSFGPASENVRFESSNFGEFDVTGAGCTDSGIEQMSGEQRCTVSEAEAEKTIHTVVCTQESSYVHGSGGHSLPVGFEENVELSAPVSKKPFSIIEST
jgi:hypothetical protein